MKTSEPRIVPVSALRDNYIWALCNGPACLLVDPGEAAPALGFLRQEGLDLCGILLTHRHADHQGGTAALLAQHPVPVWGPASSSMPLVTQTLAEGDQLQLAGFAGSFEVLAVPGHTEEHLAYLWQGHLFCGDTLFAGGCGRLLGGTAAQLHASLERLATLPDSTLICCAHEYTLANLAFAAAVDPHNPALARRRESCAALRAAGQPTLPASLAEEKATNPFLRCNQSAVRAAAETHAGHALPDSLAVFTTLRNWKNEF